MVQTQQLIAEVVETRDEEQFLTAEQVAEVLGIPFHQVWRDARRGYLAGAELRFRAKEIWARLEGCQEEAGELRREPACPLFDGEEISDGGACEERINAEVDEERRDRLLLDALKQLSDRQAAILVLRFGLAPMEAWTQEQVAVFMGISRQRVAVLETRALGLLQESSQASVLSAFLE